MRSKVLAAVAALTIGLAAAPASALVFTAEGQSAQVAFNGFISPSNVADADLHALLTLTLFDIDAAGDSFTFDYTFQNTSTGDETDSRIPNFGFDATNFASASIVNGFYANARSGNVVAGQDNVDFCATDGNNCTAGGNANATLEVADGIVGGRFIINLTGQADEIELTNLLVRWISVGDRNAGSGYGAQDGCVGAGCGGGGQGVPEPATWVMMILGFFGAGSMIRRRYRVTA